MPRNPLTDEEFSESQPEPQWHEPLDDVFDVAQTSNPHVIPRLRAQVEALKQALLAAGVTEGIVEKIVDEADSAFD